MIFTFMLFSIWLSSPSYGKDEISVFDVITVSSAITPPVAEYILQNINESTKGGAAGLIILLDTPGGLDLAMRDIVKGLLNAPLPVIVFVFPAGARAASAGAIITVAAHVAAMAPGTNMGAAHPVGLGIGKMDKTMAKKVENDAVAYGKSIAKKRGRNEGWVERAIKKSESITAEEALRLNVIDFVAADISQLLAQAAGKEITLPWGKSVLKTRGAIINHKKMGVRHRILSALSDPNIAYILLLMGLAGLYFEFSHPGAILPGVVGGISLILAFFALQTLSVNYAGVLLIIFGILLFIAEIKVVSHGLLTVGGIISLVIGSLMLFASPDPALRVSLKIMIPMLATISLFFAGVIALVLKAQTGKRHTGKEGMVGKEGRAITDIYKEGKIFIKGEYWNAFSDKLVEKGKGVRVVDVVDGLRTKVEEI